MGEYAFIAAGAVVNRDVPSYALMAGVPSKQIGWIGQHGERLNLPISGEGQTQSDLSGLTYRLSNGGVICLQ